MMPVIKMAMGFLASPDQRKSVCGDALAWLKAVVERTRASIQALNIPVKTESAEVADARYPAAQRGPTSDGAKRAWRCMVCHADLCLASVTGIQDEQDVETCVDCALSATWERDTVCIFPDLEQLQTFLSEPADPPPPCSCELRGSRTGVPDSSTQPGNIRFDDFIEPRAKRAVLDASAKGELMYGKHFKIPVADPAKALQAAQTSSALARATRVTEVSAEVPIYRTDCGAEMPDLENGVPPRLARLGWVPRSASRDGGQQGRTEEWEEEREGLLRAILVASEEVAVEREAREAAEEDLRRAREGAEELREAVTASKEALRIETESRRAVENTVEELRKRLESAERAVQLAKDREAQLQEGGEAVIRAAEKREIELLKVIQAETRGREEARKTAEQLRRALEERGHREATLEAQVADGLSKLAKTEAQLKDVRVREAEELRESRLAREAAEKAGAELQAAIEQEREQAYQQEQLAMSKSVEMNNLLQQMHETLSSYSSDSDSE